MNFLNSVETFLLTVELGSFTSAANARNITPGSISIQISELEKELGARLFHRSTRKLVVSDEGRVVYERFKRIFQEINETKREFSTPSLPSGKVRILATSVVAKYLVLPMAAEFSARYPDVSLEFAEPQRTFGARNDDQDVILAYGNFGDTDLVAKCLGTCRVMIAGSDAYLARFGEPRVPEDLRHHRCLGFIDRGLRKLIDWRFGKENHIQNALPPPVYTFDNAASFIEAGIQGLGLVYVPDIFLREPIARGQLKPVLTDFSVPFKGPYVLHHPDHLVPVPQRVKIFVDFLFEKFMPTRSLLDSLDLYRAGTPSPPA